MSKHTFPSILCRVCAPRPKAFLFFDSKWHAVNNFLFSCAQAPNSLYKFKKKKSEKKIIWSGSFLQGQNSSLRCDLIHNKVWRRAFVPSAVVKDVHILQSSQAQRLGHLYAFLLSVHAGPDPCLNGPQGILCEDSAHNWLQGTLLSSFLRAASLLTCSARKATDLVTYWDAVRSSLVSP